MIRLLAYLGNEADRIRCALHPARPGLIVTGPEVNGWGLGFVQGGQVLLHRRPRLRTEELDFYAAVQGLRTSALVGHASRAGEDGDASDPFHFRGWLFASTVRPAGFGPAREAVGALLPDFLRRSMRGGGPSEHLFHLVLHHFHDAGYLDAAQPRVDVVAAALGAAVQAFDRALRGAPPLAAAATNGQVLAVAARGHPVFLLALRGIADCPVCGETALPGSEGGRVRHEHLRALIAVASDGPADPPPGWEALPERSLLLVDARLELRVLPMPQS